MKPLNMKPNENFAALSWHFFSYHFFGCNPMIKYAVLLFCLTKNQSFDWNWTLTPPDDLPKRIMLTLFSFFFYSWKNFLVPVVCVKSVSFIFLAQIDRIKDPLNGTFEKKIFVVIEQDPLSVFETVTASAWCYFLSWNY